MDPKRLTFQCHCRECQYITVGNANIVVVFAENDFNYNKGITSSFARSDLENPVTRHFCGACGTSIGSRSPSRPNSMIIKWVPWTTRGSIKHKLQYSHAIDRRITTSPATFHHLTSDHPKRTPLSKWAIMNFIKWHSNLTERMRLALG